MIRSAEKVTAPVALARLRQAFADVESCLRYKDADLRVGDLELRLARFDTPDIDMRSECLSLIELAREWELAQEPAALAAIARRVRKAAEDLLQTK